MVLSKTSTEVIPSKNPKNPKTWYVKEKVFNNDDILYIVEKLFENAVQWKYL